MADDVVTVPVQSGWFSKINWTQGLQALAAILVVVTGSKVNITPDQQAAIVTAIVVIGNVLTVIWRQYFTKSITPQSVTK